jgi:hypothetical protein
VPACQTLTVRSLQFLRMPTGAAEATAPSFADAGVQIVWDSMVQARAHKLISFCPRSVGTFQHYIHCIPLLCQVCPQITTQMCCTYGLHLRKRQQVTSCVSFKQPVLALLHQLVKHYCERISINRFSIIQQVQTRICLLQPMNPDDLETNNSGHYQLHLGPSA